MKILRAEIDCRLLSV